MLNFILLGALFLLMCTIDYIEWKDEVKDMEEDEKYDEEHKD